MEPGAPATSDLVCYCFSYSREEITTLIRNGCRTLEALQETAMLCTRCQSCRIDVEMLLDAENGDRA